MPLTIENRSRPSHSGKWTKGRSAQLTRRSRPWIAAPTGRSIDVSEAAESGLELLGIGLHGLVGAEPTLEQVLEHLLLGRVTVGVDDGRHLHLQRSVGRSAQGLEAPLDERLGERARAREAVL